MTPSRLLSLVLLLVVATTGVAVARSGGSGHDDRKGHRADPLVIAHRGASGYRPEHTLAAYELGARLGADYVEPDLVRTKDGVLVARHENEISGTTDVASHPEFADRRTTKTIDGVTLTGWFTEDFTLAELKTLRAVERIPALRPRNTRYNGFYEVPTFQEVIDLTKRLSKELGRPIGIYPETKHPSYFRGIGLPLEEPLDPHARPQRAQQLAREGVRAVVRGRQPADARSRAARPDRAAARRPRAEALGLRRCRATRAPTATWRRRPGCADIAEYADGVGPSKDYIVPRDAAGNSLPPTTFVRDAHRAGLLVHPYTFRNENSFLPLELRSSPDPAAYGNAAAEYEQFFDLGVDGLFSDNADTAVRARGGGKPGRGEAQPARAGDPALRRVPAGPALGRGADARQRRHAAVPRPADPRLLGGAQGPGGTRSTACPTTATAPRRTRPTSCCGSTGSGRASRPTTAAAAGSTCSASSSCAIPTTR